MSVLLIPGSPAERSRSAALLDEVGARLSRGGAQVSRLHLRDLSPQALLLADTGNRGVAGAVAEVAEARVVVVATPVYKAAYSGVLKVFLDLLSQNAFKGKTILPLATGGSANHMLAVDYALRPVLQSMGPRNILPAIFATDAQVTLLPQGGYQIGPEIDARLEEAVQAILSDEPGLSLAHAGRFASITFERMRCSV